jgi:hypothetical protein
MDRVPLIEASRASAASRRARGTRPSRATRGVAHGRGTVQVGSEDSSLVSSLMPQTRPVDSSAPRATEPCGTSSPASVARPSSECVSREFQDQRDQRETPVLKVRRGLKDQPRSLAPCPVLTPTPIHSVELKGWVLARVEGVILERSHRAWETPPASRWPIGSRSGSIPFRELAAWKLVSVCTESRDHFRFGT